MSWNTIPLRPTGLPVYHIVFLCIIATIPLPYASVQPVVWTAYAALILALFVYGLWRGPLDFGFMKSPPLIFSIGLFLGYTLFQSVPIPLDFLRLLNPYQYGVVQKSAALLGETLRWHSLSYVSFVSFAWWIFLLSLFLFFAMLQTHLKSSRHLVAMVYVILAVGLAEAVYGLMQALVPTLGVLRADLNSGLGDARGTFINRNHFAGFMEMVWPLGLGLVLAKAHQWTQERGYGKSPMQRLKLSLASDRVGFQLVLLFSLLLILLALLFSRSRAGITGGMIGFVSFVVLMHIGGRRFSWPAWAAIGMGGVFLLVYGGAIGYDRLIERFLAIEGSAGGRLNIWKDTWGIILDHPWGVGLGNYEHVMPVYNIRGPYGIRYSHAHNDYLQLLAETGWPGFLVLVGGFYLFLANSILRIRRLGRTISPTRFYIGVGAVSGLMSMAFHGFFDFNLQIPTNMLYFVTLMAIVHRNTRHD